MKYTTALSLAGSLTAFAVAEPVVHMCGDSTMAIGGGGADTQGWGQYLGYSLNLTVSNAAMAGRSARSYTREARFDAVAESVEEGDFVIIEFGHNDGGYLTPTDNGRSDCPGAGDETCSTVYNSVRETVLTYPSYLINAAEKFQTLGATVILSVPTPSNPWETGSFVYYPSRFTTYAASAADSTSAEYVDHGQYLANMYETLGDAAVTAFYPHDHTHTSPEGAAIVAQTFVKGIVCADSALAAYVVNATASIAGSCI